MMRWGAYHLLIWVWLIIPLAWFLFRLRRRKEKKLAALLHPDVQAFLLPTYKRLRARTKNAYWLIAILFCFLALARPQWGFHLDEVRRHGLDIMVVLDTSKSMLTSDIKPTRLQQAKWGVLDLIQKLQGDRIGLITFAGSSFLQCPLTLDYAAFLMSLDDVYAGIIPRGGTAIGPAIERAINSFEYTESNADRVVILVTDGEDHNGSTTRWVEELKKKDIRVYAIGVGTLEGDLIPTQNEQGVQGYIKDSNNQVVKSSLNETPLQELALGTGGIYVRSAPGDFGLERIYDQGINQLQRDEQESRVVKIYEDRFVWFLLAALLFLIIEASISGRIRPNGKTSKAITLLIVGLLFTGFSTVAEADEGSPKAKTAMNTGLTRFNEAIQLSQSLAEKTPEEIEADPELKKQVGQIQQYYKEASEQFSQAADLARTDKELDPAQPYFNLGDAWFQQGDWAHATMAYKNVLESQNTELQSKAYFNLGITHFLTDMTNEAPTFEDVIGRIDQSMSYYEKAMMLNDRDEDAKINYELMMRQKNGLIAARDYLLMIIAQSRQLIKQGRYEEALKYLQQAKQQQNTQQAMKADADTQKNMTELEKKVNNVVGVINEAEQAIATLRQQAQAEQAEGEKEP